jgi:lipid-A-disaccharide synthase
MKFYLIAGEASGDMHGASLIKEILLQSPDIRFRAWGGEQIENTGASLAKHIKDINFMGFTEVLLNIRSILGNFKYCKKDITSFDPDAVIFIDYPGFNLRMAGWAHKNGYKVIYYISPQIWAWNSKRVHGIKKTVDKMLCILPFEKEFYNKYNYKVDYVGHPLIEAIKNHIEDPGFYSLYGIQKNKYYLFLPGSRIQEIKKHLPVMLQLARKYPEKKFCIAAPLHINKDTYIRFGLTENISNVQLIYEGNYHLLNGAYAAIVSSGTATLETALFKVPQVVMYIGSRFSFLFAKWLIKVSYISLVNLILQKQVIVELIQNQAKLENLASQFEKLHDSEYRKGMISDYDRLEETIGVENASKSAAKIILDYLQKK